MVRPGFKQTEVGEIPEDWDVKSVSKIASITTGAKNTQDRIDDGAYPFFVRSQIVERINSYSFDGEAVLTAGDGVGTGKIFHYINGKFDYHQRVYNIHNFKPEIDGFYFFKYFSSRFYDRIMSMTAKSSVDSVRREMIADMMIALPTKPEQKAIATALSDVDELIVSLEKLIAKKRDIKTATMQQLLTGKTRLPSFGEGKGTKQTELGEIPEDWEIFSFFEKVDIAQGQVNPLHEPYRSMVLIGLKHVESGTGKLVFTETAYEQRAISGKYIFMKGDVLYGKINPYLMKATLAKTDGLCSADMYPLRPKTDFSSGFLLAVILGEAFTKYAVSVSARSGMPKINRKEFAEFKLLAPTNKEEQTAIASILTEMDDEILYLQKRCAKIREIKQGMMQELLTGRTRLVDPTHQVEQERLHGT